MTRLRDIKQGSVVYLPFGFVKFERFVYDRQDRPKINWYSPYMFVTRTCIRHGLPSS